jgi:hypothetical protein
MRADSKKVSSLKKTRRSAKTAAKRSRDTLLKSAPVAPPPEAPDGNTSARHRWLVALVVLAIVAAGVGLILSSDSFRSRAEVQPVPNEQTRLAPQALVAAPVRADALDQQTTAAPDPEVEARRDYVLALATGSTEAIDLFLSRHPEGFHADLARMQRRKFAERELPAVIRQLNVELKRVGCGPTGNAEWTAQSQQALAAFNKHAQTKFDVKAPDADTLKTVKEKTARVCPAPAPAKAAEVPQQKRGWLFWE